MRIAAVALVVLFGLYLVVLGKSDSAESVAPTTTTTTVPSTTLATTTTTTILTTTTEPTTTTAAPEQWNLMAGGDVLMDRGEAAGVDMFAGLVPQLSTADISLVNVEMAISDRGTAIEGKTFTFRAPPAAAVHIGEAGVDIANLGNNHARDYGTDALLDTIDLLETNGVQVIGAGANREDAFAVASVDVGEIRVAFVGITYILPGGFSATSERAGVASGDDVGVGAAAVARAKEDHDVVIVTIHWGIERRTCPEQEQFDVAREMLAAGATAVIGHHPHVLEPVVFEDGKLVAYSMGNFLWHRRDGITGDTGILELKFLGAELQGFEFHPHTLDSNGAPVPVQSEFRRNRMADIIAGDCAKHDPGDPPPPASTTTTAVVETTVASTTTTVVTETTAAPTTAVPTTATTTATTAVADS